MSELWWYVARSSGLTAWAMVVASMVLGISLSGRFTCRPGVRRWLLELHPWVSGTALGLVVLHVTSIVADSFVDVGVADALVPLRSSYRTTAVAWGTVGFWILVVLEVTSVARRRLGRRTWHAIHFASYGLAVVMTVHALSVGTDTSSPWLAVAMVGALFLLVLLTAQRVAARPPRHAAPRPVRGDRPSTREPARARG
jgi:DMSO/TMAO reductase YedYZ heme-binding membrane subunit